MKKFLSEFKAFITRGNILDMAVGVVIGGAFSAIVTALVNILLSVCTWGVPGGIKGLVTVLPAINDAQKGMNAAIGLDQKFSASELQDLATKLAVDTYGQSTVDSTPTLIENVKSTILTKYTLHGTTYTYNLSAVIDWGTFINAIISFIIVAITLFIIVKVAMASRKRREQLKDVAARAEMKKAKGLKLTAKEEQALKDKEAKEAAEAEAKANEPAPQPDPVVVLLQEIRDSLKNKDLTEEK